MIDNFALVLSHALMALAVWRLLQRADLDSDTSAASDEANGKDDALDDAWPGARTNARKRRRP
jgi:hypothetical protein